MAMTKQDIFAGRTSQLMRKKSEKATRPAQTTKTDERANLKFPALPSHNIDFAHDLLHNLRPSKKGQKGARRVGMMFDVHYEKQGDPLGLTIVNIRPSCLR